MVPIFLGQVLRTGQMKLDRPKDFAATVSSLKGQRIEVIVRRRREKRSLDQNAYLHAVPLPMLAEHLGYDSVGEMKFDLMGEKWGWMETKGGHQVPVKGHTSAMTTAECAEFIEWLVRFGAKLPSPLFIPLPNEAFA